MNNKHNNIISRTLDDHIKLFCCMKNDRQFICDTQRAAEIVLDSIRTGGAVYFCGNGGSAADSQHIATEFVSRFYMERRAFNAEALTVNTSSLTAIGNDYSFDRVFERQLEAKCRPGDVLIGISTSGLSNNVINALDFAVRHDVRTILLTGNRTVEKEYDCIIAVPSEDTPRIQEAHICVGHMIAEYVEYIITGESANDR